MLWLGSIQFQGRLNVMTVFVEFLRIGIDA
jgi:hypothetical protein